MLLTRWRTLVTALKPCLQVVRKKLNQPLTLAEKVSMLDS